MVGNIGTAIGKLTMMARDFTIMAIKKEKKKKNPKTY
jgi:hypothetical protein